LTGTATAGGVRFTIVGPDRYFSTKTLLGGTWVRLDHADASPESSAVHSWLVAKAILLAPSQLLGGPDNAAVRRVGQESIGAEPVTKYRADTAGGPTTVYVDDRNRVRRMLVDRPIDGKRVTLAIDVTRWGETVRITAPPSAVEFSTVKLPPGLLE
jgi:hypothetical protein